MLTKGIVEEITTPYSIKVRLPIYDKLKDAPNATSTENLSQAIICALPNSSNHVSLGDIVIVGFEDNDTSKPIILGTLFCENLPRTYEDLDVRVFTTHSTTKLFDQTSIGKVTPEEIKSLRYIRDNIQGQIDTLQEQINNIRSQLNV